MANYLKIIGEFFPTASVQLNGIDPSVYSNITWSSNQIAQSILDSYVIKATNDVKDSYARRIEDATVRSVINNTASVIVAGTPVYSTGTDSLTGRAYIASADSNVLSKLPVIGVVVADITAGNPGIVCGAGILKDVINTSTYIAGDILYVASGGGITNIKPTTTQWQQIATVNEVATTGDIIINLQAVQSKFTQRSIDIAIFGATTLYYRSSTVTSFTTVSRFVYRGSNIFGPPSYIKVVAWSTSGGTAQVRLYDITNSLAIATSTSFSNTTGAIIDLGTISNVPASDAILEFQILTSSASKTAYISSGHIYFN